MDNLLKQSPNINLNYAASIQRVEAIEPIKGADKIVTAVIGNNRVVTSADMKVGDIVVYFPAESAICKKFLWYHNEYAGAYLNRNKDEYIAYRDEYAALSAKPEASKTADDLESMKYLANRMHRMHGIFCTTGRVKMRKIHGAWSTGYIVHVDKLIEVWPILKTVIWSHHFGEKFDMIDQEKICWKWEPPVKQKRNPEPKREAPKFDRLFSQQFQFHYETNMLVDDADNISPFDEIDITVKVHGRSIVLANVLTQAPRKLSLWEKTKKFFGHNVREIEIVHDLLYSSRHTIRNQYIYPKGGEPHRDDDKIYKRVANDFGRYIAPGMTVYGEIVGYIEGTNECLQPDHDYGCTPGTWKFMPYRITMTTVNDVVEEWDVGRVIDWTRNLREMLEYENLGRYSRLLVMQSLYHGRAGDMYNDLYSRVAEETTWEDYQKEYHDFALSSFGTEDEMPEYLQTPENFVMHKWRLAWLDALKKDRSMFMELPEPMCRNRVPREGIVIRRCGDPVPRAWKLKTMAHWHAESMLHDDNIIDPEDQA